MGKWITVAMYLLVAAGVFNYREEVLAWVAGVQSAGDVTMMLEMFLAAALISLFPVIPFGIVGGMIGATYGLWTGGLLNMAASTLGAAVMFLAARYGCAERGRRYMERIAPLQKLNGMMEKNPVMTVLIARTIPILPAAAINIYAALMSVPFISFLVATALGKLPVMLVFAFVGEQLLGDWTRVPMVLLIYAVYLAGVYAVHRLAMRARKV
ncbi:VTT domain-containing protein [Paenibacillus sp. MER TA 81-3]|uniref:TVP38/TMEM64 family protein n=1 Tax=Paenibacillus sp. MER TA 81-3 TaxID=2939573 RepID=UPI00203DB914|nr:VTT domain-containing protein [Paenibacillus sp. MER TA 81-3]MCM3341482.1 VTT domain-containing protein [Paenibacillus sp. MER TA 81-3]